MGKIVSFFRHRADDPGATLAFEVTVQGAGKVEIDLYSRGKLPEPEVQRLCAQKSLSDDGFTSLKGSLVKLAQDAEGGILVQLFRTGDGIFTEVRTIEGHGYTPPKRFLNLTLGAPARFEKLKAAEQQPTPLGSRLLIPVDPAAETELEAFLGHVRWLSPDVESLVLDSLSRPSLESRVADLERQLGKSLAEAGSAAVPGWLSKVVGRLPGKLDRRLSGFPSWLRRPLQWGASALALALLLFLNTLLIKSALQPVIADEVAGLAKVSVGSIQGRNPGQEPASPSTPAADLPETVKGFHEIVKQFREDSKEAKILKNHFKSLPKEEALKAESFAYGLVKLLAVVQDMEVTDKDLESDAYTATKVLLSGFKLSELSISELNLLGYATCNAFPENEEKNRAGIKSFTFGTARDRVDLPMTCKEIKDRTDLAAAGLQELTARLEKRLEENAP